MEELHLASQIEGTLRHPIVCLSLLSWHLIAVFFIGASDPDIGLCERLMRPLTIKYPNGAIILFLKARLHLIKGDIDNAIYFYGKSISVQDTYKQFHHVCWWELLFAYCYLKKWDRAANNAKKLLDESKWSRCCYTYMLGILINADRSVPKRTDTVRILLERVPQIRHRIAGKSIPVEKFCARKSERFLKHGRLFFAHYEFLYFWNGFSILSTNKALVGPILEDIEAEWEFAATDDKDDECLYLLLKGVTLKIMGKLYEAELCFLKIMEYERIVTDFSYIVPNACFELAMTRQSLGSPDQALSLLQRALTYRGYSLETKLHFRIQAAMEALNNANSTE
uniref:TPR_REGION domain-containing protein n=1 Tax=Panagrellus redivivus TaxID=6233 RepID=A0A7E4VQ28_PANRE